MGSREDDMMRAAMPELRRLMSDRSVRCANCHTEVLLSSLRMERIDPFGDRMCCQDCQRVARRQDVERKIITRLVSEATNAGFPPVETYDGGEYIKTRTAEDVLRTVFSVNEATIAFQRPAGADGRRKYGVFVVLGNSGWDVITDYHTDNGGSFDAMMARVEAYAETFDTDG